MRYSKFPNWLAALLLLVLAAKPLQAQEDENTKFNTAIKDLKTEDGVWKLYHNDQKLLLHLKNTQLEKNYIVITSIARGISSGMVLGGMSWNFGEDAIWAFKKVGDKLHVVRRNVRFKAKKGTPEASAVELAYSDSVLYALPVISTANNGYLVDLTRIFMSDDQQIGEAIGSGFRFSPDRSVWAKVKGYPQNVELQVAAVYAGGSSLETVADPRGVQVHVHYSISELPTNNYKPRAADDRVGYFLTAMKDFSEQEDEHFVRYINRWHLEKADPKAKLSPPKEPIIFYMEKTVPISLRPYVQSGIEEWNKAFEKIGFANAIQVRQQRDDDTWDPEDIRYNTFRWITAEAGFAMGPSRVNPLTGQILDADIIFDSSFLQYWKQDYEDLGADDVAEIFSGGIPQQSKSVGQMFGRPHAHQPGTHCMMCRGMQHQMSFSAAVMLTQGQTMAKGKLPDEFIHQALKEVVMHEVGHTLGLRHNFKASSWKSMEEIDKSSLDTKEPTVASVMDYAPANIVPAGQSPAAFYTPTIGPYDEWAIEYGYKPFEANEEAELAKIAARNSEPGLDYATDEDTRGYDADPLTNRFDLGKDPINYAERQMKLTSELLPKVVDRSVETGEGFQRARQAFGALFSEYWRSAYFIARFPGGLYVNRDHKIEGENQRAPFQVVEAEQQRRAMKVLMEQALSPRQFDAKTLNYLAATRWSHWGMSSSTRLDYPIHDVVGRMQAGLLSRLLDSITLQRMQDNELKVAPDQDCYTLAEHLRMLVDGVFTEWKDGGKPGEYNNRNPYIQSFRRNLQRDAIQRFVSLVNNSGSGPEDARTLARMHLVNLEGELTRMLDNGNLKLDDYTRAHLMDSRNRIQIVLKAELQLQSVR